MNEYEVNSYEAFRRRIRDELRPVENAKIKLFHQSMLHSYLESVKAQRRNLADNCSDSEILDLMGVTAGGVPTIAGVMTFFLYPQAYFPQICITAVSVPGTQMDDTGQDDERFIDNERLTGPIPDMVDAAVEFVRRNMRVKTIIDENGKRADKDEYPMKAALP